MTARVDNSIVIQAPIDLIWEITNDVESWPDLFSDYATAEILVREGNTTQFRLTLHPDDCGSYWSWVSERTVDPATRTVRSRRVETGPFESMASVWEFTEVGSGTQMRWVDEFHLKAEAPASAEAMAAHINRSTQLQLRGIRDRIEARLAD
ncbi:SRPBCC family protein [Streptomyces sp. SAJ15]|uniref:SRPBCC family protein n=1 Tax=Streptomyces sp. SAJ15 TaxID=2011095 RepID=UPI0011861CF8|nr:SRPBCC family protein [Streptomyces sp. SAJ15]TVL89485.1 polyketide cyclase [Streptomyces sp. SAJ15]